MSQAWQAVWFVAGRIVLGASAAVTVISFMILVFDNNRRSDFVREFGCKPEFPLRRSFVASRLEELEQSSAKARTEKANFLAQSMKSPVLIISPDLLVVLDKRIESAQSRLSRAKELDAWFPIPKPPTQFPPP